MNQGSFDSMWKVMKMYNLETNEESSSEFKCSICKKILVNASIAPCGCRFCLDCITEYLIEGNRKCPGQTPLCDIDQIDIQTDIHVNRLMNIQISRLTVKCPNIDCQSQLELNMIADHLRICEHHYQSCPFISIGCEDQKLQNDKVKDHLNVEICAHSKLIIEWMSDCRNEIYSLKRDVIELRKKNELLEEKLRSDGEKTQNIIRDSEQQEKENSSKIQILDEEISISQLESIIKSQNDEIIQLKTNFENQNNEIETLKHRCEEIRHKTEEKCMKMENLSQINYAAIQFESVATTKSIQNMKEIIDKTLFGEFVWVIDNWTTKVRNAKEGIFSDFFLTHQNGYKICLTAKYDKNNHYFNFGFCIAKGAFDEILQWPFDRDMEFSFINQLTGGVHQTITIESSLYHQREEFQKPRDENKTNPFYHQYLPRLIPQEFLQNNRIYIKLISKPVEHKK